MADLLDVNVLVALRVSGGVRGQTTGTGYGVDPDGRSLINIELDSVAAPITLLMSWKPEGKTEFRATKVPIIRHLQRNRCILRWITVWRSSHRLESPRSDSQPGRPTRPL